MCKTYAFSGPVLRAGPAEQFENTGMIGGIDAASVVPDVIDGMGRIGAARDLDVQRFPRPAILQGIINEIGEDLFHGQAVGLDLGQAADLDAGAELRGAVGDGVADGLEQAVHVDPFRLELAAALARELEHRVDQPVHVGDRRLDEADGLVEILPQPLDLALGRRRRRPAR